MLADSSPFGRATKPAINSGLDAGLMPMDIGEKIDPALINAPILAWYDETTQFSTTQWRDKSGNNRHLNGTTTLKTNQENGYVCRSCIDPTAMSAVSTGIPSGTDTSAFLVCRRLASQTGSATFGRLLSVGEPGGGRPDFIFGLSATFGTTAGAPLPFSLRVITTSRSSCDHGVIFIGQNKLGGEISVADYFELLILGRLLTATERTGIINFYRAKYGALF